MMRARLTHTGTFSSVKLPTQGMASPQEIFSTLKVEYAHFPHVLSHWINGQGL
jgi:hypothetical protein